MTQDDILRIFREHGALLEGHFILSSGLHSNRYIQCALVLQYPQIASLLGSELASKLDNLGVTVVAAPALVVEDVITTGGSTRETIECVEGAGGRVLAVGSLIDRSGGKADLGQPKASLVTLEVQNYHPSDCPLCQAGSPAVKPGSRPKPQSHLAG